ncbi:hypothetical protein EA772_15495 [Pedobacter sp. G11]|uniref:hypothetical protein n=1 Tax=Pedobacter sp. G11 TaxID=2482728 RepID=UPI000F5ED8AB|nr:hypothetical protein [Pedobacter sp. G11]AZI26678.1 hypothetical protein EA772_15495 [Pedobacter sp. G11]
MKVKAYPILLFIILITSSQVSYAQLPQTKFDLNGDLRTVESGMLIVPPKNKYDKLTDSLEKNLKQNPSDTTSLFYRALLYYSYNQMLAEPAQRTKGTLENLTVGKDMIEKAIQLNMTDFRALLLRAQIYHELCYRFSGDERWMFSPGEVAKRKKLFENYKGKTNKYYTDLIKLDGSKEYLYNKKKIT